ncbi:hypothetical protein, partial [Paenibacillus contaminans]|uniref:hypothetical protein n=1 Tax=Paenibacillus contaminans TaxID=450362 RepID=UPI001EDF7F60
LSPPAPMVLDPQGSGRVGRRQAANSTFTDESVKVLFFCIQKNVLFSKYGSGHLYPKFVFKNNSSSFFSSPGHSYPSDAA